jgi:di/tricarboxylate transporter
MDWHGWVTLGAIALMATALLRNLAGADVILLGTLVLLTTVGVIDPIEAVGGFDNEGLITVATMFIVATGLSATGGMSLITAPLLGRPRSTLDAQIRLMLPVTALSAFLNNTPLVAMFMPVVNDWCKKSGISPSKLFIPLSYAAILGGTCTLIGTSTNLVVNGLLLHHYGDDAGLRLFDIAYVGLPAAVVGIAYCLIFGRRLLPDRNSAIAASEDLRRYTVEMVVEPHGPLVGQTIEEAGLRHLPGLYLAEIERNGEVLAAVGPEEKLGASDRLVFVGVVESVVDLWKMRGLLPATDELDKLGTQPVHRQLVEAVVSNSCPLVGKSIREGQFRTTYNAAVIAVGRGGERLQVKIGDVVLQPGDTLLLETGRAFAARQRNSTDFYLVSALDNSTPPRHERAWIALAILVAMILLASLEVMSMLGAAMAAAVAMVVTRCCTGSEARRSPDWSVLLVIGASFGIGEAMKQSGSAAFIAGGLMSLGGANAWTALVTIYAITMIFNAFITNNAAAVLVFPIAQATAEKLGVSIMPFAVALMFAGSNDFATPIGYQTNLMVYGPGGYRFVDYVRFGGPLNLLMLVVGVVLIPIFFPFHAVK